VVDVYSSCAFDILHIWRPEAAVTALHKVSPFFRRLTPDVKAILGGAPTNSAGLRGASTPWRFVDASTTPAARRQATLRGFTSRVSGAST